MNNSTLTDPQASLQAILDSATNEYHCFLEASDRVTTPMLGQFCQNVARQRLFFGRKLQALLRSVGIDLKSSASVNELADQLIVVGSQRSSSDEPIVRRFIEMQEENLNSLNYLLENVSFPTALTDLLENHRDLMRSQLSYLNQLNFSIALAA